MPKYDGDIDRIYDLIALRLIVKNEENCYQVLGLLHSMYTPMVDRIKDYIAHPKTNGYQSLHTTVTTDNGQAVEFQIRTRRMHEFAERGLAASFHYHEQKSSTDYREGRAAKLPKHLQWITQLQQIAAKLANNESIELDHMKLDLFNDRIFVYSPKGDIYNLPEGSYPLDFAYLVHSDIGEHAQAFKVNGKIVPFDRPLSNGDRVEVITRRRALPKGAWLMLTKTAHAREKLRAQLKRLTREAP